MKKLALIVSVISCSVSVCAEAAKQGSDRPNIVLIMADDMGYEALSVNGSESCKSPNLDKLADQGISFTNCFANPLCTPSRAKIMTGQYNVRNYVNFGLLDRGQTTYAHQLKAAGYKTCIAGKWQLGKQTASPQHFGFEQSCLWPHTRSGRSKENNKNIDRRFVNPLLEFNGKEKDYVNGEYGPQVCTDFVCDFIDRNKEKPFLVYYPMILTHCPFDPTPDSSDWDPKRLGSTAYKGDRTVRENTLLIFTGDNGTDKPIVTSWNGTKVAGGKGSMTDAGTRVPLIASWPAGIKQPERVVDDLVEFCDLMPTLCEVTGADLPPNYAGDGSSIVPVLQNNASARKKDWIYIWYRGQVMVRNNQYSLLAKTDGSDASLTRYKGPFDGEKLEDSTLSQPESAIKQQFKATLTRLAKSRLLSVSNEIRVKIQKPRRNKK